MKTAGVADVLVRIVEQRRRRAAEAGWSADGSVGSSPAPLGAPLAADHPFLAALSRPGPAVVAEVKMGSPRLGSLAERVDPEAQARTYAEAGAAALSVVVEPDFFGGSYELLARCREVSGLPAIAKDFVVHPHQLELARQAGASAVLLIAALYGTEELANYAGRARRLGLVPLIETHSGDDLARLGDGDWELVGVNNRDLRTFEVDLEHSLALLPRLPAAAVKVAESGISRAADVGRLHGAGFDAFLVGESLLLADDPAARLHELLGRSSGGGR